MTTAEEIYPLVTQLPPRERLRLVEKITHDLLTVAAPAQPAFDWTQLAGTAPGLLRGEDAQAYVSRSRQDADATRERASRGGT